MHVAQPTAQGLIIRFYPLKIWLLCLFLAALGLGTMVGLGRVTILTCDRITPWVGTCMIESLGLEGDRRQTLPLIDIHQARLNATASIVLDTHSGPIPLTAPLGSNPNLSRALVVTQINQFLANPVAIRLTFQDDGRPFAYPCGLIFLLGSGVMLMMFGPIVSYEVDRHRDRFTLTRQTLLSTHIQRYPLQGIHQLQVESDRHQPEVNRCRLYLIFHSGQRIPLAQSYFLSYQDATWAIQQLTPQF